MTNLKNFIGKVLENANFIQIEIVDIIGDNINNSKVVWKFVGETKKHKTTLYFDGYDYYINVANTRVHLR